MSRRTTKTNERPLRGCAASLLLAALLALVGCAGSDGGGGGGLDAVAQDGGGDAPGAIDAAIDAVSDAAGQTDDAALTDTGVGVRTVVINEVLLRSLDGGPDWIELYNPRAAAVDVSGWSLRDDDDAHEYVLPPGTVLPADGYFVVEEGIAAGDEGFRFGFGAADAARLFDADGVAVDETVWQDGAAPAGTTWGRYPNGAGPFATLSAPTPGATNAPPRDEPPEDVVQPPEDVVQPPEDVVQPPEDVVQPPEDAVTPPEDAVTPPEDTVTPPEDVAPPEDVQGPPSTPVINEVFANPVLGTTEEDWFEIHNPTAVAVDVSGWTMRDDDDLHAYVLPEGTVLEPGGFVFFVRDESGAGLGFDFGLNANGDMVRLYDLDGALVDQTAWIDGQVPEGQTWGRHPDGSGPFWTLATPTPGAGNVAPVN